VVHHIPSTLAVTPGRLDRIVKRVSSCSPWLALGQKAQVMVDSHPNVVFTATVVHIADEAEFTPRNVQTVEGRRATVYAVKLDVPNPEDKLKPGMPADVTFAEN
jgi:hypothetical protein